MRTSRLSTRGERPLEQRLQADQRGRQGQQARQLPNQHPGIRGNAKDSTSWIGLVVFHGWEVYQKFNGEQRKATPFYIRPRVQTHSFERAPRVRNVSEFLCGPPASSPSTPAAGASEMQCFGAAGRRW